MRYLEKLIPIGQARRPLQLGIAFHSILEAFYKRRGPEAAQLEYEKLSPDDRIRIAALGFSYVHYWHDDLERYKPLCVEKEFDIPMVSPSGLEIGYKRVVGKIDMLAVDTLDGKPKVFEHKTTESDIGDASAYWDPIPVNNQPAIYSHVCKRDGYGVNPPVIYNVVKIPTLRRGKSKESDVKFSERIIDSIMENPSAYFARREFKFSDDAIKDMWKDVWGTNELLQVCSGMGHFPRHSGSCRFGRNVCEYMKECTK